MLVIVGEDIDSFEVGDTQRLIVALEGVLGINIVLALTDEKADGGIVSFAFQQMVGAGDITAQLPEERRFELSHLDLHDDVTVGDGVVEEQVHKLLRLSGDDAVLSAHIGETGAHLDKELGNVIDKGVLQILLVIFLVQRQEVEIVWIFGDFLREIALGSRKSFREIGYSLPVRSYRSVSMKLSSTALDQFCS